MATLLQQNKNQENVWKKKRCWGAYFDEKKRLDPIAKALDKIQSDKCNISDTVLIWKDLIDQLEDSISINEMKIVLNRYRQAMTPAHSLAYMINPKLPQKKLSTSVAR